MEWNSPASSLASHLEASVKPRQREKKGRQLRGGGRVSRAVARRARGARRGDPQVGDPQLGTGYQLQTLHTCTRLRLSLLANSRMHMGREAVSR